MNSIKTFIPILLLGVTLGACEDLLEPDKDNQYSIDRVMNDPAFAEGILLSAYLKLPTEYSQEDVATDNAVSNNKNSEYLRMATGEWSALFNPLNVWTNSYDAIFNINYFLSVVNDVNWSWQSDDRKQMFADRFKGEALALRGYFHFTLLLNHGGVASDGNLLGIPLVTEVINSDGNWKLPRNTYQQCIDRINADFDTALALLPYKWEDSAEDLDYNRVFGSQNQNRIQGQIIKALKAKVAMHTASPAFNNDAYDNDKCRIAIENAGELLTEIGGVSGLDPQGNIFYDNDNDESRPEILWRNDYDNSNSREKLNFPPSLFGEGHINPTQNLVDAFPMENGYPINAGESGYDPAAPYDNRDSRLKAYIIYNGNNLGGSVINTDINNPVDGLNNTTASTRTGYYLLKLLRTDVNIDPNVDSKTRHFYTYIRYTEVFLIYAEAANEIWGPDADPNLYGFTARDIIAAIRQRADISAGDPFLASISSKEEMRELIRNERRLELCFEGFRFWDMRRWKQTLTETAKGVAINESTITPIDVENRNYQSYMYFGPIPNREITKYDGLFQNQGW
ncbi:MAG: RagB/SusD family nutrient uptake outer membrane protein [Bacteroidales bacterium]|nr:RagB/SusD family nutrient uptake outer membrane protein [Bacteroidales bacterium]